MPKFFVTIPSNDGCNVKTVTIEADKVLHPDGTTATFFKSYEELPELVAYFTQVLSIIREGAEPEAEVR